MGKVSEALLNHRRGKLLTVKGAREAKGRVGGEEGGGEGVFSS
jgi:hypothetical protein